MTARSRIDPAKLDAQHVKHLTMLAAMKAYRKATGQTSQTKPGKGKGSRREAKSTNSKSKASGASSSVAPVNGENLANEKVSARRRSRKKMSDSESSTTPECSSHDDTEDGSESAGSQAGWDGKCIGSALGSLGAPAADEATKKKGAKPVRVARGEQVIEYWGGDRFAFARIMPKGVLSGYGAYCARHSNSDGYAAKTPCKKAITLGNPPMTEDEARLRLKRWIIAGSIHMLEPETRQRQAHIDLGGKRLDDFASGGVWGDWTNEDLDVMLDSLE